jgi:hypothetical protein
MPCAACKQKVIILPLPGPENYVIKNHKIYHKKCPRKLFKK